LPYHSDYELFGTRRDVAGVTATNGTIDQIDGEVLDDEAIEETIRLLPEIGRSLYFALARHPRLDGVPLGQLKTLSVLCHQEPRSVREFADNLGVSMATASETLDRLVELGLAQRSTDPTDRRRVIVAPTPEARRIAAEVREVRRFQVRAALERLDPAERPVFFRALRVLVEVLRDAPESWLPDAEAPPGTPAAATDGVATASG
jgi:DNA-binding MarR family transcriptional regulator